MAGDKKTILDVVKRAEEAEAKRREAFSSLNMSMRMDNPKPLEELSDEQMKVSVEKGKEAKSIARSVLHSKNKDSNDAYYPVHIRGQGPIKNTWKNMNEGERVIIADVYRKYKRKLDKLNADPVDNEGEIHNLKQSIDDLERSYKLISHRRSIIPPTSTGGKRSVFWEWDLSSSEKDAKLDRDTIYKAFDTRKDRLFDGGADEYEEALREGGGDQGGY